MATAGSTAVRAPLPAQPAPVLHVAQLVVACLAVERDGLHVLVRRTNTSRTQDKSDTAYALPRRWIGRPSDLDHIAGRALEFTGIYPSRLPTKVAITTVEAAAELRPAAGLISIVMSMLSPPHALTDRHWSWLPITELHDALSGWDVSAIQSAREAARDLLRDSDLALQLLPDAFSLGDLRRIYTAHWDVPLNPSNFSRRALSRSSDSPPFLEAVGELEGLPGKPTVLYRRGNGSSRPLAPS